MIRSHAKRNGVIASFVLSGMIGCVFAAPLVAQQASRPSSQPAAPVVVVAPADYRFQQVVQQQKARDQAQQSQLEQQLHQSVSDTARRPMVVDPAKPQQPVEKPLLNSDPSNPQHRSNPYRPTPVLPRVIPKPLQPSPATDQVH